MSSSSTMSVRPAALNTLKGFFDVENFRDIGVIWLFTFVHEQELAADR